LKKLKKFKKFGGAVSRVPLESRHWLKLSENISKEKILSRLEEILKAQIIL